MLLKEIKQDMPRKWHGWRLDKLWVDDVRDPPYRRYREYDIARTYDDAVQRLNNHYYDEVFLDHDLGDFKDGKEHTGYDVLLHIVQMKQEGKRIPQKYTLLTANPVGRQRMQGVIDRYLSS